MVSVSTIESFSVAALILVSSLYLQSRSGSQRWYCQRSRFRPWSPISVVVLIAVSFSVLLTVLTTISVSVSVSVLILVSVSVSQKLTNLNRNDVDFEMFLDSDAPDGRPVPAEHTQRRAPSQWRAT